MAAFAHMRFTCPAPRSTNTGIKDWACGVGTDNPGYTGAFTTFSPGLNTLIWEETINHNGAPLRLALAFGDEDFQYVLLDHIPHWDQSSSSKFYKLNVNIPDVNCPKCALQLVNMMTDKISSATCDYSTTGTGTCFSVYHSCANVIITGSQDAATWKQNYLNGGGYSAPAGWTYTSTPNVYSKTESASWNGWLSGQANTTAVGPCASGSNNNGVGSAPSAASSMATPSSAFLSVIFQFMLLLCSITSTHRPN